jgi:SRSO17 transposase
MQEHVADRYGGPDAVGIIDETTYLKKGRRTPGVQRQHCGAVGKRDNCTASVHLALAAPGGCGGFRVLLDGELFLPQEWSDDRARCREAGIPDDMVYRPKWQIALELLDRAVANGVRLAWLTFDEGYGRIPEFHGELSRRGQLYVAEVPCNFWGWCKQPEALGKNHHPGRDPGRRRLKVKSPPASRVDDLGRHSPLFYDQPWQDFYIKNSAKGPIVWQAKAAPFHISCQGLPSRRHWLIIARNALDQEEIKYLVSNAPLNTSLEELLRVAFSRASIERCFEDDKSEVGMDHFEVRNYRSLKRHLILSALSLLFLTEVCQQDRGEKSGVDALSGASGSQRDDPLAGDEWLETPGLSGTRDAEHRLHSEAKRRRSQESPPGHLATTPRVGHQDLLFTPLSA